MNVKSVFTGLFTNQRCQVMLALLLFSVVNSSFTEHPDRELMTKQANILIRKIGHHLLLQTGDSTSRVLPVTEMNTGIFLLRFDNEFVFHPDSMMALTKRLLTKADFPAGFILTVHDCANKSIVYGFQVNSGTPDILSCSGRKYLPGCYTIEFTFPDFYNIANRQKAGAKQLSESDTGEGGQSFQPITFGDSVYSPNNNAELAVSDDKEKAIRARGGLSVFIVSAGILALLVISFLMGRFGKRFEKKSVSFFKSPSGKSSPSDKSGLSDKTGLSDKNPGSPTSAYPESPVMSETIPAIPALGKFLFDVKNSRLLLDEQIISLTDKECRVLELLHNKFGELLERETLLQEVWIKEGVITGRSLDMFVSKLRKKLSPDPGLVITNVHGKGYSLRNSLS